MARHANSSATATADGSSKRPASADDNPPQGHEWRATKKLKKSSSSKRTRTKIKQTKPLPFFELPGALRNLVYEQVAKTQTVVLEKGGLTDSSGLLDVNERIRDEYYSVLLLCAGTAVVEVTNFDFRQIVTFFNKLSDAELSILPNVTKPTTRALEVHLNITRPR